MSNYWTSEMGLMATRYRTVKRSKLDSRKIFSNWKKAWPMSVGEEPKVITSLAFRKMTKMNSRVSMIVRCLR